MFLVGYFLVAPQNTIAQSAPPGYPYQCGGGTCTSYPHSGYSVFCKQPCGTANNQCRRTPACGGGGTCYSNADCPKAVICPVDSMCAKSSCVNQVCEAQCFTNPDPGATCEVRQATCTGPTYEVSKMVTNSNNGVVVDTTVAYGIDGVNYYLREGTHTSPDGPIKCQFSSALHVLPKPDGSQYTDPRFAWDGKGCGTFLSDASDANSYKSGEIGGDGIVSRWQSDVVKRGRYRVTATVENVHIPSGCNPGGDIGTCNYLVQCDPNNPNQAPAQSIQELDRDGNIIPFGSGRCEQQTYNTCGDTQRMGTWITNNDANAANNPSAICDLAHGKIKFNFKVNSDGGNNGGWSSGRITASSTYYEAAKLNRGEEGRLCTNNPNNDAGGVAAGAGGGSTNAGCSIAPDSQVYGGVSGVRNAPYSFDIATGTSLFTLDPSKVYHLDIDAGNRTGSCHKSGNYPLEGAYGTLVINSFDDPNWNKTGTAGWGGKVTITGLDSGNSTVTQSSQAANGVNAFGNLPPGRYKVVLDFPGRFLTDNPPSRQENSLTDTSIMVTAGDTTTVTYHTALIPSATLSPGTASCTVPYNAAAGGYNPDQCSVNVAYRVNNVPSAYARINKSPWPSGFEPTFGSTGYITPIINLDTSFNDTIQYKFTGQQDGLPYSYWASIVPGATNNPFYIGPLSTNVTRNAVHGPQTFNTVSGGIFWDNNVNSQYDPPASGTPDTIPYDDPNDAERLTVTLSGTGNTYTAQSTLPSNPSYTVNAVANPGYTLTTSTPAGYSGAYVEAPSTFDVPSAGPITRRIAVKGYQMQGKVCIDGTGGNPVDGICQAGETLMPGSATITVTTNGGLPLPSRSTTTNTGNPQAGKNYQIKNLRGGGQGYNVTISNLPSGYTLNSPATVAVIVNSTLGNADFAVVGSYNLDVTVKLTDAAGNCTVDPGANPVSFTLNQSPSNVLPGFPKLGSYGSGAAYSFGSLQAVNYELTVNFSNFYANYKFLKATVAVPPSPPVDASYPIKFSPLDATKSVWICITNNSPWWQVTSGDVRMNRIRNQIPGSQVVSFGNGTLNSNGTAYGMLFSSKGVIDMGSGSSRSGSNTKAWVFDNESTYNPNNETINSAGSLSFSRLNSIAVNIPKVNYAGPSIPATQAVSGSDAAYYINNSVTLSGGVSIGGSNKVIILVKGDVTLTGNIIVAPGALLLIAASGNITIDSAVGDSNYGLNTTNFDGIFTAEGNIAINGTACSAGVADPMLRVGGALIANAAQPFSTNGAGGKFINNRSLCANDATIPTVKIFQRPDFIFVLPDIIKKKITITKEVQP